MNSAKDTKTRFPSPAEAEKMPKCSNCGHIDPEHGFNGPCEADWGKCPCKRFIEPDLAQARMEALTRESKATNDAPYHVEGRTVVMVTRSGKHLPVAVCDFLSAEYVCAALSAYWGNEREGIMYTFEEKDRE